MKNIVSLQTHVNFFKLIPIVDTIWTHSPLLWQLRYQHSNTMDYSVCCTSILGNWIIFTCDNSTAVMSCENIAVITVAELGDQNYISIAFQSWLNKIDAMGPRISCYMISCHLSESQLATVMDGPGAIISSQGIGFRELLKWVGFFSWILEEWLKYGSWLPVHESDPYHPSVQIVWLEYECAVYAWYWKQQGISGCPSPFQGYTTEGQIRAGIQQNMYDL